MAAAHAASGNPQIRHHHRNPSLALFELELEPDERQDGTTFTAAELLGELLTAAEAAHSSSEAQRRLFYDAQEAHALALNPSGEVGLQTFAQILALRGHLVWLRTGRPDCCCGQVALRHTFVLAGVPGSPADPTPQLFVVDPVFRDSFQLPNATPRYTALWEALPSLFVGTAEQLLPIVELMCAEMQRVFADTASSCPPWRTASCMLTKWLPSAADDVPVVAHVGAADSDTSTHTPGTNSALGSPVAGAPGEDGAGGLFGIAGVALLAPIRTGGAAAADAAADGGGLTPHSSCVPRSPLYFDAAQQQLHGDAQAYGGSCKAAVGLLSPGAHDLADLDRRQLLQAHYPPAGARDALSVRWVDQDRHHADAAGSFGACRRRSSDGLLHTGGAVVGSWGYASTCSSPGVEAPMGLLRSCFSEDGSGRASDAGSCGSTRRRGVAIGPRCRRPAGAAGTSGFGEAFAGRSVERQHTTRFSPDVAGLALGAPASGSKASASTAHPPYGGGFAGAAAPAGRERAYLQGGGDASLDISRFDRSASLAGDLHLPPLLFGLAGERGLSGGGHGGGGGKPSAALPPAARRRGSSSSSSQCSALSAAIAGRGLPACR